MKEDMDRWFNQMEEYISKPILRKRFRSNGMLISILKDGKFLFLIHYLSSNLFIRELKSEGEDYTQANLMQIRCLILTLSISIW
jgi:hypothetical protein